MVPRQKTVAFPFREAAELADSCWKAPSWNGTPHGRQELAAQVLGTVLVVRAPALPARERRSVLHPGLE